MRLFLIQAANILPDFATSLPLMEIERLDLSIPFRL
jgi:hypothetical protein